MMSRCRALVVVMMTGMAVAQTAGGAEKDKPGTVDELRLLRLEIKLLRNSLKRLQEENARLKEEVQRLRRLCHEAGIDARRSAAISASRPARKLSAASDDHNTKVARAIHEFAEAFKGITSREATDIQKRIAIFKEMKKLDRILRSGRTVISYTVEDVAWNAARKEVSINPASVRIKSSDPDVPDVVLHRFYWLYIAGDASSAKRITTDSQVILVGTLALGVDFSRPVSWQPATSRWVPGFTQLGTPRAFTDERMHHYTWPSLVIRRDYSIYVDGVKRVVKRR